MESIPSRLRLDLCALGLPSRALSSFILIAISLLNLDESSINLAITPTKLLVLGFLVQFKSTIFRVKIMFEGNSKVRFRADCRPRRQALELYDLPDILLDLFGTYCQFFAYRGFFGVVPAPLRPASTCYSYNLEREELD